MAHRLTSYLEIRMRAAAVQRLTAAYCIADERAIVYRLRADRAEGIAGFNNPPIARQYLAGVRRHLAGQRHRRARRFESPAASIAARPCSSRHARVSICAMVSSPDVTVAALVEREGRFLLVEERIAPALVFNQPAGHLEGGETLLQAVVRETLRGNRLAFHAAMVPGHVPVAQPARPLAPLRFAFIGSVTDIDARRALDHVILRTHWLTRDQLAGAQRRAAQPTGAALYR